MRIPKRLMPHGGLVRYRVFRGTSANGPVYDPWVTPARACIQERRRLVKGSATEELSTATVWLDPDVNVPVGTEFEIWVGYGAPRQRVTQALQVQYYEHGPGLPEHIEVLCQ